MQTLLHNQVFQVVIENKSNNIHKLTTVNKRHGGGGGLSYWNKKGSIGEIGKPKEQQIRGNNKNKLKTNLKNRLKMQAYLGYSYFMLLFSLETYGWIS